MTVYLKQGVRFQGFTMTALREILELRAAVEGYVTALLSFLAIPVVPLHFVGIATSTSVMLTFLIAVTVMPAVLSFGKDGQPCPKVQAAGGGWLDRRLEAFGQIVLRREKIILSVFVLLTAFLIYQMTKIETSFDVERTMGRNVPYVKKILEVTESELGSIYSYDMMIDMPEDGMAKSPQALMALEWVPAPPPRAQRKKNG